MNELENALIEAVRKVAEWIQEVIKIKIQEDVYNAGVPLIYERTYEFLNSFNMDLQKLGNYVVATIFFDPTTMECNPDNFQHGSNYSDRGSDLREALAEVLNDNKSGALFGYGYWMNRKPFFDDAVAYIDENIFKQFELEMTALGIPWIRG
ncbi:MAG: hypothetical protein AB9836_04455 [Aminipila sp.]